MKRSAVVSAVYGLGMVLLFLGERLFGAGAPRVVSSVLGAALILGAVIARTVRLARTTGDVRSVERTLLALQLVGAGALVMYVVQSDVVTRVAGASLEQRAPRVAAALGALWPAVWLAAAAPLALCELAYAAVARAARLETGRIRDAKLTGLGLAAAAVFAFTVLYVAGERDGKLDLSHFRTARPGESTRKIVRGLGETVQVAIFFPPANEVREELVSYFDDLGKESKKLEVRHHDFALDPLRAKELGVTGNGIVVVARGGRKEPLSLPLELEAARHQLRGLDRSVQKQLLSVAKPPRNAYFTHGHGERSADRQNDTDRRDTVRRLRELMEDQGFTVKDLGPAEGLATDVPADAGVVLLIGPTQPLLAEEAAALVRHVERGGRLFVALDPEAGLDMADLLKPIGLQFETTLLANDQIYARRTGQPSDRINIATGAYSSHPSVTTIGRLGMRAPLLLFGAGSFTRAGGGDPKDAPRDISVDFTVHAHPVTWSDTNRNFELDAPGETRGPKELAAAVTRRGGLIAGKTGPDGRVVALADADAVADTVLPNTGNAYFMLDGLRWLAGDEAMAGEISNEQDVPIAHTRKQNVAWFYSSVFIAPVAVLGLGYVVTRRRRRGGGKPREAAPGQASGGRG